MAGLYVDTVKSRLYGKPCGIGIQFGERVKILVADDIFITYGTSLLVDRVSLSDHRHDALSARVRKLENVYGRYTAFFHRYASHITKQCLKAFDIFSCEHHLPGICSSFGANGISLKPNYARTAFSGGNILFTG